MRWLIPLVYIFTIQTARSESSASDFLATFTDGLEILSDPNGLEAPQIPSKDPCHDVRVSIESQLNFCDELSVGSAMQVDFSGNDSFTGVRQRYNLSRDGEKIFTIGLNLTIWTTSPNSFLYRFGIDIQKALQDVKDCMSLSKNKVITKSGVRVNFEVDYTAPKNFIRQSNYEAHRSSSLHYEKNISCPTILHELFHLTGLVDGYHEEIKNYPYRHISPLTNMMNSQNRAVEHYILGFEAVECRKLSYIDDNGNDLTDKLENSFGRKRKSMLSKAKKTCLQPKPGKITKNYSIRHFNTDTIYSTGDNMYFIEKNKLNIKPGILSDEQFNIIRYPGCKSKNQRYYDCSKFAYMTEKNEKPVIPEYCQN